ncbi:MAG: RdgB/HAM1 family non-canonical purine NTP pyrophosphatase [Oscillospiraceae bacterium]|nr:RdgB/HAM1 family non-canonical purine NTP pyrophosphatase [Oscillospiraceae bacterium]
MKRLILASNNRKKLLELQSILADTGIEVLSQREAGCDFEVDENGETFEENAYLKAIAVTQATGEAAIADDSGLCVDALDGEPGVYSARYTGNHEDTDEMRNDYLLSKLENVENRSARFVSCICCTLPNGDVLRARGECEGEILRESRGSLGFGYDPVFLPEGFSLSMGEIAPEVKNAISHRAKALDEFKKELREYNAAHK